MIRSDAPVDKMAAAGVEMSADQCWNDYRFGAIAGLFLSVTATMMSEVTESGDELFVAMATRHGQQTIDLDTIAFLESTAS